MNSKQHQLQQLERSIRAMEQRLSAYKRMCNGQALLPNLWVDQLKVGAHSIMMAGNRLNFGDAAANPTVAGDVQRNGDDILFHDGTSAKSLIGGFWQELGRTELSVAGATITVNPIAARKNLMILAYCNGSGGAVQSKIFFNADEGSSYALRYSFNGGADATEVNTGRSYISSGGVLDVFAVLFVRNVANKEKLMIFHNAEIETAGAGTAPRRFEQIGKWTNTASQITRVDVQTFTGNFAAGSICVVLGSD